MAGWYVECEVCGTKIPIKSLDDAAKALIGHILKGECKGKQ